MQLCEHHKKSEKADWDGVCSGVWCVCNKTSYTSWTMRVKASFFHDNQVPHPKYQCFCVVISVRIRKIPGKRGSLVFSLRCFRCAHTLTCIMRGLHLHVSTDSCMLKVRTLVLHALCNHGENLSENPSSCTYLKDPRPGVHYSCWRWVPLQLHMHINPGLLDCEVTTTLLRPICRRPLRRLFVVPTLGGHFLTTWKRGDGLHTLFKK
jgi:hypothetical protein